jgi:hypothetical protein
VLENETDEIREQLNQNNHNNSKPPSGDGYRKPTVNKLSKWKIKRSADFTTKLVLKSA